MVLYQALEAHPGEQAAPDFGLFDVADRAGAEAGDDIAGNKQYDKHSNRKPRLLRPPPDTDPRRRRAYCAIREWAIRYGYPDPASPTKTLGSVSKNACPGPRSAHVDE